MPKVHLNGQGRICGAVTTVTEQSSVWVDGELWAVHGDPNSHGLGGLIASATDVYIEGKLVIMHAPDSASPDGSCPFPPDHCNPKTSEGYDGVLLY